MQIATMFNNQQLNLEMNNCEMTEGDYQRSFTIPKMDYRSLYEFKEIDFTKLQEDGSFDNGIAFTRPQKNKYEIGADVHILPYSGHVIMVSKLLDVSYEELCDNILQDDEKQIIIKNYVNSIAMQKLSEAAMKIEGITDRARIVDFEKWQVCLDNFEEDAEDIAVSSSDLVEQYYRDILIC